MHTLGLTANTDLETMRSLAVHVGSQQSGLFLNGTQFRLFEKQRGSHATIPLHNDPIGQGFYQAISKKNLDSAPMLFPIRSNENVDKSRQAQGLSLGANPTQ